MGEIKESIGKKLTACSTPIHVVKWEHQQFTKYLSPIEAKTFLVVLVSGNVFV